MVPSLNVKSVASVSNTSECWIVIVVITRHTRNTNVHIAIKDSTIRSIWRDMFELTLVCCQKIIKNHQKHSNLFYIFSFLFKNDSFHIENGHIWVHFGTSLAPCQCMVLALSHHPVILSFKEILTGLLGVKPYKCQYCEKSFTQRCSLESHQDKIHGIKCQMPYKKRREKIYVCEECGFSTGDVRLVTTHCLGLNPRSVFLDSGRDQAKLSSSWPMLPTAKPKHKPVRPTNLISNSVKKSLATSFLILIFFSVSITNMPEKLIVTMFNVTHQHIPNIINRKQLVLKWSKLKQAVVEPVKTSLMKLG